MYLICNSFFSKPVIDIMRQWKIEPSLCTKFIKETVTKKYESFVSRKASALGDIGKKLESLLF